MKRKFDHPAPSAQEQLTGPKYWRSLDALAGTPGFKAQVAREFPEGASEMEGVDRRNFMKIMAASFALGGVGLAGCRRPEKFILPYGKSVEGIIPGLPSYYATAMPLRKSAEPLLAETHQGRPTKLEGNPDFTPHGGGSSLHAQASVLDLYDPDRATAHTKGGKTIDAAALNEVLAAINRTYSANGGAGLAFLADESSSPTRARLVTALRAKFPSAIWSEFEPVVDEAPAAAAQSAFGSPVKALYDFSKAKRIVSIDADFLHADGASMANARSFSKSRRVEKKGDPMNRLYVAESTLSLTGMMADHRLRLASSHMLAFTAQLASLISSDVATSLAPYAQGLQVPGKWLEECVADLKANAGSAVVVAGAHLPASVHFIVHGINVALNAIGSTVRYVTTPASNAAPIADLVAAMNRGAIRTLVVLDGNPVYNAPADLGWAAAQTKVPEVIRYGYYVDETSALNQSATTHIAGAHYLESWGDARAFDGTVLPIQPMILPLFGGLTQNEVIARIAGEAKTDSHALVVDTITGLAGAGASAEKTMQKFLHDGMLAGSAYPAATVRFNRSGGDSLFRAGQTLPTFSKDSLEVRILADGKMDDGRFANNGWLQECPDSITKIAWDNVIMVSPKLGKELGIDPAGSLIQVARKENAEYTMGKEKAFVFELSVGNRKIKGPVHIQPGLANYTVVVSLGYGRTVTGHVGKGAGYNAYPIRTSEALHVATGAKLTKLDERQLLANTQEHWSMEGRDIVREANLDEYEKTPTFVDTFGMESHAPSNLGEKYSIEAMNKMTPEQRAKAQAEISTQVPRGNSLYSTPKFDGHHQWGMSIDMNVCIGCNACVVACQAENNIPIVGREQVARGREMHWIRIDRYYSDGNIDAAAFGGEGNKALPEDPQISVQPIACMQCELAPCETVCPVNATVHDDEGLNTMAYNRCIGTRYCANNCPYKVRRFNFFDWNQRKLDELYMSQLASFGMPEIVAMGKNPEVTVRMRGVMEKCTYCVQRIQNAKIQHKVAMAKAGTPGNVNVPDKSFKVACQQSCPVDGIAFGDIKDPNSEVSKAKARDQEYEVLGYLNIRPRTTYSGKLRNPNPKMPDYRDLPASRIEYKKKNEPQHHGHDDHAGHGHAPEAKDAKKGGH
ncbi:MAG: TAT-variant-translocated molybdopterin oxidoreductase [Verrucomicrobiota bacterium]